MWTVTVYRRDRGLLPGLRRLVIFNESPIAIQEFTDEESATRAERVLLQTMSRKQYRVEKRERKAKHENMPQPSGSACRPATASSAGAGAGSHG